MASMWLGQDPRDSSVASLTSVPGAPWDFVSGSPCSSGVGAGIPPRLLGWGEGVWVSMAQHAYLGNCTWGQLSSPSQWPHFPPWIRHTPQGGQPWSHSGLAPAMPSFQGSSGGTWAPVGPGDTATVFLSFPRGTRGRVCTQHRVTVLDIEVPSVTETEGGRPVEGTRHGRRAVGDF